MVAFTNAFLKTRELLDERAERKEQQSERIADFAFRKDQAKSELEEEKKAREQREPLVAAQLAAEQANVAKSNLEINAIKRKEAAITKLNSGDLKTPEDTLKWLMDSGYDYKEQRQWLASHVSMLKANQSKESANALSGSDWTGAGSIYKAFKGTQPEWMNQDPEKVAEKFFPMDPDEQTKRITAEASVERARLAQLTNDERVRHDSVEEQLSKLRTNSTIELGNEHLGLDKARLAQQIVHETATRAIENMRLGIEQMHLTLDQDKFDYNKKNDVLKAARDAGKQLDASAKTVAEMTKARDSADRQIKLAEYIISKGELPEYKMHEHSPPEIEAMNLTPDAAASLHNKEVAYNQARDKELAEARDALGGRDKDGKWTGPLAQTRDSFDTAIRQMEGVRSSLQRVWMNANQPVTDAGKPKGKPTDYVPSGDDYTREHPLSGFAGGNRERMVLPPFPAHASSADKRRAALKDATAKKKAGELKPGKYKYGDVEVDIK